MPDTISGATILNDSPSSWSSLTDANSEFTTLVRDIEKHHRATTTIINRDFHRQTNKPPPHGHRVLLPGLSTVSSPPDTEREEEEDDDPSSSDVLHSCGHLCPQRTSSFFSDKEVFWIV